RISLMRRYRQYSWLSTLTAANLLPGTRRHGERTSKELEDIWLLRALTATKRSSWGLKARVEFHGLPIATVQAIQMCDDLTERPMNWCYIDDNRVGDHIWWISDVRRFRSHYPEW